MSSSESMDLLGLSLDLEESLQNFVIFKKLNVLFMKICFVGSLELLFRLSWVDTLQNAQPSEIFQVKL